MNLILHNMTDEEADKTVRTYIWLTLVVIILVIILNIFDLYN